ncbi:dynein axonemal assembly factor 8 [Nematostella vectensis]|uniref:dynein axonemal assembly factor 8 n=1 Tax=Nematostella vectensis TaxID=45351 RepID=UPI0020771D30|nr:dynein axonemal assembly factor 8 [Nematostella vectensis]
MDSSSDSETEVLITTENGTGRQVLVSSGLKPVLDGIFAEVNANIPQLDFDSASEASSDSEEPQIFSRTGVLTPISSLATESVDKDDSPGTIDDKIFDNAVNAEMTVKDYRSPDSGLSAVGSIGHKSSYSDTSQISFEDDTPVTEEDFVILEKKCQSKITESASDTNSPVITEDCATISRSTGDPLDPPVHLLSQLEDINFDAVLRRLNEVSVSPQTDLFELNNNNVDSGAESDTSNSSDELMQQLVTLSEKQSEEAVAIPDSPIIPTPRQSGVMQDSSVGTEPLSSQSSLLSNERGIMAMLGTASIGVSLPSTLNERSDTRRLDLRADQYGDRSPEKVRGSPPLFYKSMQKVLANDVDSSSSSGSEDEDMASWHEQRRKFKAGLLEPKVLQGRQKMESPRTAQPLQVIRHTKTSPDKQKHGTNTATCVNGDIHQSSHAPSVNNKHRRPKPDFLEEQSTLVKEQSDKVEDNMTIKKQKTKKDVTEDVEMQSVDNFGKVSELVEKPKALSNTSDRKPVVKNAWGVETKEGDIIQNNVNEEQKKMILNEEKESKCSKQTVTKSIGVNAEPVIASLVNGAVIEGAFSSVSREDRAELKERVDDQHREEAAKKHAEQLQHEELKEKKMRMKGMLERVQQQRDARGAGGLGNVSAPSTPVLFDMEASYEYCPATLPELSSSKSYLLLTATLSSPCKLVISGSKGGSKTNTDSTTYTALLTWLLSLVPVPDNLNCSDLAQWENIPFHVIGLQQTWHEGQLSLIVGIRNRVDVRKQGKGNSFLATVNKFLRTKTLSDVLPQITQYTNALMMLPFSQRNLSCMLMANPDPEAMARVFKAEPGFFWHTHKGEVWADDGSLPVLPYKGPECENTMMLAQYMVLHEPVCMMDVLSRVWREGLDLAGLRLLYVDTPTHSSGLDSSCCGFLPHTNSPVIALAMRGPCAVMRWVDVVGPADTNLARLTDPRSLRALYSHEHNDSRDDPLFYCPRNSTRASVELARWFGGRVSSNNTVNFGCDMGEEFRAKSGGNRQCDVPTGALNTALPTPPSTLTACTPTSIILVLSPLVPARFLGEVLLYCHDRGFSLLGIRRARLHPQRLKEGNRDVLGLTPSQVAVFCPMNAQMQGNAEEAEGVIGSACTVMCLRRENALHHIQALSYLITDQLLRARHLPRDVATKGILAAAQLCFTSIPYTDHITGVLGHKLDQLPHGGLYTAAFLSHSFYSNPELEQVCVVTLLRDKVTQDAHDILRYLLQHSHPEHNTAEVYCGLELLGIKLITSMSLHQAKEFSPYEIGDKLWQSSLKPLTSGPALICALRGINAFSRLRAFIHSYVGCSPKKKPIRSSEESCPDLFMSPTPEIAYRQLTAIFYEQELHADHAARVNLHLLPPPRRHGGVAKGETPDASRQRGKKWTRPVNRGGSDQVETLSPNDVHITSSLLAGPCPIVTLCVVKPDAVPRHVGKVLRRLVREGFRIVQARMMCLSNTEAALIACRDADFRREDKDSHVSHLTSGPVLALSLLRENAVGKLLEVVGPSCPQVAHKESQFYLRGSYGTDRIRNAIYASPSYSASVRDHMLLFHDGLCCSPTIDLIAEEIPCLTRDSIFDPDTKRSLAAVPVNSMPSSDSDNPLHLPASLLEINCVLLHPSLLFSPPSSGGSRNQPGYPDVVDGLLATGLQPVGMRMLRLDETQSAQCTRLYSESLNADVKPYQLAYQLQQGPCLVMAVLRDGAVTSFDTLLGSPMKNNSLFTRFGMHIFAARTTAQARRLLVCFFDQLMPNRKARIETS